MADAERYLQLIEATLRAALKSRAQRTDSMALALDFVAQTVGETAQRASSVLLPLRFVDGADHSRPLYRGLTLYALDRVSLEADPALAALAAARDAEFSRFVASERAPLASEGSETVGLAFDALAIACSREAAPSAGLVLETIAALQQPDGQLLARTASDNPEPMWYHELALLHALSSYSYRFQNERTRAATMRAATYQAEQIQPDHASSHPFALHTFLRSADGTYLADMMLHAAGVQSPATMDSVSLLLLADALDCVRSSDWRE